MLRVVQFLQVSLHKAVVWIVRGVTVGHWQPCEHPEDDEQTDHEHDIPTLEISSPFQRLRLFATVKFALPGDITFS